MGIGIQHILYLPNRSGLIRFMSTYQAYRKKTVDAWLISNDTVNRMTHLAKTVNRGKGFVTGKSGDTINRMLTATNYGTPIMSQSAHSVKFFILKDKS